MAAPAPLELKTSIVLGHSVEAEEGKAPLQPLLFQVEPPQGEKCTPSDICCVIDISGSMGAEAVIQQSSGVKESHGLNLLDIAKHGVRTVIHSLGDEDRLAVVAFNHGSQTIFDLTQMTKEGKEQANTKLDSFSEGGGTNIWQGLERGLEVLRIGAKGNSVGHVMLLTDGQTADRPVCMSKFEDYKNTHGALPGTVSTFGFGYNIDSELLCKIATAGSATYSFIPDAGFVGTVFVNTLSNLLVTCAKEVFLELTCKSGFEIENVPGTTLWKKDGSKVTVEMGTLQYGQQRDVLVELKAPESEAADGGPFLEGVVRFTAAEGSRQETPKAEVGMATAKYEDVQVGAQMLRCLYIDTVKRAMEAAQKRSAQAFEAAQLEMQVLAGEISKSEAYKKEDPFTKALLEDVTGQSTEAFSKTEYYWKWGVHYMPSIAFAHKVQQCNNFKDPSVQLYGGKLFQDTQEKADETFNTLAAPQPSVRYTPSGNLHAAPAAPVSMAAYNDRYGVCIDAASRVQLEDGTDRKVGDLVKGDRVLAPAGKVAEVVCLVRTRCQGSQAPLVELRRGCRVTPYHPVLIDSKWQFPSHVAPVAEFPCEAVCSLVLKGSPALLVGGCPCIGLAHGLKEEAAAHPYFGTQRVLEDLQGMPGFEEGLVELQPHQVLRDPATGNVCRFIYA